MRGEFGFSPGFEGVSRIRGEARQQLIRHRCHTGMGWANYFSVVTRRLLTTSSIARDFDYILSASDPSEYRTCKRILDEKHRLLPLHSAPPQVLQFMLQQSAAQYRYDTLKTGIIEPRALRRPKFPLSDWGAKDREK